MDTSSKAANSLSLNELSDKKARQPINHHNFVDFVDTEGLFKFMVNVT